jgi:hypothetical protein
VGGVQLKEGLQIDLRGRGRVGQVEVAEHLVRVRVRVRVRVSVRVRVTLTPTRPSTSGCTVPKRPTTWPLFLR